MFKPHIVLRLTLTSGEQMALDVTCGQFGWRVPIAPWEKWRSHRAMPADREKVTRLDVIARQEIDLRLERDGSEYVARDDSRREMVTGVVEVIMREATSRGLSGVTDILKLPTADYKKAEYNISDAALNRCLAVTEAIHKAGVRRWYFDQTPVQRLTRSPEEVKALQGVWLSQELIDECKYDEKKLQKLYMLRCMRKDKKTVFKKLGMKMSSTKSS
ncbi:hypothetical protein MN608_01450 [Microdochium nivale]|nr:hypothetical protein MN608_01450 [Microdochium nivale]